MRRGVVARVLLAKKTSERLDTYSVTEKALLSSWCNLTDDWCWISNLRRMIARVLKNLQVPIMTRGIPAIRCFGRACVRQHKPAGERDDLIFVRIEFVFLFC